jgi:N-hydroxyarylamine O-acetyltransferase
MTVDAYLERIGYRGSRVPGVDVLRALHRAHLMSVPFENLDIHSGREIVLEERLILDKLLRRRRGGFCYELNGAFAWLLRELGFEVVMLSAGVAKSAGGFGPEFDHLLLRVELEEPWLADVGFGDSFVEPMRLHGGVHEEGRRAYRIDSAGDHLLLQRRSDGDWEPQYRFTLRPRALDQFADMCRFHQTSPESHFTRKRVITLATATGRITLRDDRLIVTDGDQVREEPVAYEEALKTLFDISL